MNTLRVTALVLALSAQCRAQAEDDDKAPYTPPVPGARPSQQATAAPALDEERLARIVDAAVTKAMARQNATASPQQEQAQASPQQQQAVYQPVALPQTQYALQATTTQQAQVLVPAGRFKQHLASVGQHLINCAQPRVRTMTLAPVTYTTSPTVAPAQTTTQIVSVPAVVAQPTLYTPPVPQAPATYYPTPSPQRALAAPPKAPRK